MIKYICWWIFRKRIHKVMGEYWDADQYSAYFQDIRGLYFSGLVDYGFEKFNLETHVLTKGIK